MVVLFEWELWGGRIIVRGGGGVVLRMGGGLIVRIELGGGLMSWGGGE